MGRVLDYNATLVEREDLTPRLAIFHVRPDRAPAAPWFVAGQYVTLGLNGDDGNSVRRPMTIASAPEEDEALSFYIGLVEERESELRLTHLLWRRTPGDRLYLRPTAAGRFTLQHTVGVADARLKLMIAAGTACG